MKTRRTIQISGKPVHFDLDLSQFSQKNIYDMTANGLYELETVRMMERLLKPGDTFIDVGAHVGYFSMIAAALGAGRVLAFEPNPHNFRALEENVVLNNAVIVSRYRGAVDSQYYPRAMWVNQDNDGGHAFWNVGEHPFNTKSKDNPKHEEVNCVTLDYFVLRRNNPVHLIKIDVEGSELDVLRGAQELLKANPDCAIICEINRFALSQMGTTEEELRTFMHDRGYRCWYLPPNEDNPQELPFGETTSMEGYVFNVLFKKGDL